MIQRTRIDPHTIDVRLDEDTISGKIDEIIARLKKIQKKVKAMGWDEAELEFEVDDIGFYEPHHVIVGTLRGIRRKS